MANLAENILASHCLASGSSLGYSFWRASRKKAESSTSEFFEEPSFRSRRS